MPAEFYIGIDPGKTGGWAVLKQDGSALAVGEFTWFRALPLTLKELLGETYSKRVQCILELVHSFPGQGVSSSFSFGQNFGGWQATLEILQIPYELVPPQKWQKAILGVFPKGESKERAFQFVQKKWPEISFKKKDHGIIDALCMALYAKRLEESNNASE